MSPLRQIDQSAPGARAAGSPAHPPIRQGIINSLRGLCGEFGSIAAQGACNAGKLIAIIEDGDDRRLPDLACMISGIVQNGRLALEEPDE